VILLCASNRAFELLVSLWWLLSACQTTLDGMKLDKMDSFSSSWQMSLAEWQRLQG
jgi:hypothetical protein